MERSLPRLTNTQCEGRSAERGVKWCLQPFRHPQFAIRMGLALSLSLVTAVASATDSGNRAVAAAARAVQAEAALSADLRCRIDAFGHELVGQGSYQQLARIPDRPGEKLLKLDLKVQLADQTITRQEICGPTFYYVRRESPLAQVTLGRVNLRQIRMAMTRAPEPVAANPDEVWILLGGLSKLLESLHRNFEFDEPQPDDLQFPKVDGDGVERLPVIVVRGRWQEDKLAALRKTDKGTSKDYADQIPDEVELVLGRADLAELPLFPYRLTYFKLPSKDDQGGAGEGGSLRPLLTLELFNVQRNSSLTPQQFDYQPGDQEVADLTQSYLQRMGLAKPSQR
jgi:hypothetical protein